jgi:plastocyanin
MSSSTLRRRRAAKKRRLDTGPMDRRRSTRIAAVATSTVFGLAACADDGPSRADAANLFGGDDAAASGADEATIVAQNIAFDVTRLEVAVGDQLTITYDNRENGIPHNLRVRDTATGDAMTDIVAGPITQTLAVTFDQPGQFAYLCDVHPEQMQGIIAVDA